MSKRIAAFILTIVFAVVGKPVFAGNDSMPRPIEEYKLEMLCSVGVIKSMSDYVSGVVTRMEGAEAALSMLAIDCNSYDRKSKFADVEDFTPESAVSAEVSAYGIMNGMDGSFFPNDILTFSQAVKVILVTLGYEEYAQVQGGYPYGYIAAAESVGLLNGIDVGSEEGITQDKFYKMLYNAADIPVLKIKRVGSEWREYSSKGNETFLELYHQIYCVCGKVQANDKTAVGQNKCLPKSYVQIGDSIYNAGSSDAGKYIGYEVEAYIKECYGENTVLWLRPHRRCKVVKIDSDDIEYFSREKVVVSAAGGKKKSYLISAVADFFYNGQYLSDAAQEFQLSPKSGCVEIIDNTGDGTYDCVNIRDYITFRVDRIDTENKIIFDKFYQNQIDFSNEENRIEVRRGDAVSDFYEIKVGDVLLIAADAVRISDNYRYIADSAHIFDVVILTEKMTAEVDRITNSGMRRELFVNGKRYTVSEELDRLREWGKVCAVSLGNCYDFVIGGDGQIVDAELCADSEQYGYVCLERVAGVLEEKYEIKFFDLSSRAMLIKPVAKKVTLDGKNADFHAVMTAFHTNGNGVTEGGIVPQLFKYKANRNGEITDIDTCIYDEMCENPKTSLRLSVKADNLAIKSGKYGMSNRFIMGEGATVLTVRMVKKDGVTSIPDKAGSFSVSNREVADYWATYNVEAYNCTPAGISEMIVLYETVDYDQGANIDIDGGMMFESVSQVWAEDEIHQQLNGYTANGPIELILEPDVMVKDWNSATASFSQIGLGDLRKGDIVKYETFNSKCMKVERIFSYANSKGFYDQYHYYSGNYKSVGQDHFAYGKAYAYEKNALRVKFNQEFVLGSQTDYEVLETGGKHILIYDSERDKIEISEVDGISCAVNTNDFDTAYDIVYHTHDMRLSLLYAYK